MGEAFTAYADLLNQPEPVSWLSKKQKRLLLYGSLGGAGLYFLYRAYKSDTLQALIELRQQFQDGLEGFGSAFTLSSDVSKSVMSDLHQFLNSDDDKLPQSLRQLAKMAKSEEVSEAASRFAEAAAKGFMSAVLPSLASFSQENGNAESNPASDVLTRVLEALSSEKGSNLVSLAVSMACRSSVQAYCEFGGSSGTSGHNFWQQLLEFGTTNQGEKLYSSLVGTFVREGTKVYMGSMEGVSGWDDFMNNVCKPERALAIERMTRSFVNELVVSYHRRARYGLRQDVKHGKIALSKQEKQAYQPNGVVVANEIKERRFSGNEHANADQASSGMSDWTSAIIQMSKHAEVRSLILSVAKTASTEGVRSSIFSARDLLVGNRGSSQSHDLQTLSSRNLGTILLMVFMPIIVFLAGRRSGLA